MPPESRMPRRFTDMSATMTTAATTPSWPAIHGSIASAFCTPELTDTATVST